MRIVAVNTAYVFSFPVCDAVHTCIECVKSFLVAPAAYTDKIHLCLFSGRPLHHKGMGAFFRGCGNGLVKILFLHLFFKVTVNACNACLCMAALEPGSYGIIPPRSLVFLMAVFALPAFFSLA